jgi:hypothetical protein
LLASLEVRYPGNPAVGLFEKASVDKFREENETLTVSAPKVYKLLTRGLIYSMILEIKYT